ncbi:MAG: septum formation inhibitor Maf [Planctomycetota bacterium]|jgi:hypothetical protein|nr:septum formation inhibitor Maf [Planctomycetota bacterium]
MLRLTVLLALVSLAPAMDETFRAYWYDQGAEITRYQLDQARYGEQRQGDAVLIFVTEPLATTTAVKSDNPRAADAVPGLKLNHTRSFVTGVYPYHCLVTVLQPIAAGGPHALKVSTSVQEWCGHVFEQFTPQGENWRYQLHSYFQSEGEQDRPIPRVWLEDELWTRLRIDPASLPSGEIQLVPGALTRRFKHLPAAAHTATVKRTVTGDQATLSIRYADIPRELHISHQAAFPYAIESWTEHMGQAVTTARKTHRSFGPYWQWNGTAAESRRTDLGLPPP